MARASTVNASAWCVRAPHNVPYRRARRSPPRTICRVFARSTMRRNARSSCASCLARGPGSPTVSCRTSTRSSGSWAISHVVRCFGTRPMDECRSDSKCTPRRQRWWMLGGWQASGVWRALAAHRASHGYLGAEVLTAEEGSVIRLWQPIVARPEGIVCIFQEAKRTGTLPFADCHFADGAELQRTAERTHYEDEPCCELSVACCCHRLLCSRRAHRVPTQVRRVRQPRTPFPRRRSRLSIRPRSCGTSVCWRTIP